MDCIKWTSKIWEENTHKNLVGFIQSLHKPCIEFFNHLDEGNQ